jgi:hypothetical protein
LPGEDLEPKEPKYNEDEDIEDIDGEGYENINAAYGAFDS